MPQPTYDPYNTSSNFDITKQPDYNEFLKWQKAQQPKPAQPITPQIAPQTQTDPQFKDINTQAMRQKANEMTSFLPSSIRAILAGGAENVVDYAQSANKFLHSNILHSVEHAIAPVTTDALSAVKNKVAPSTPNITNEKFNFIKKVAQGYEKGHPYATLAGKLVLDPVNFTPAGVFNDGRKLVNVAKSIAAGTAIGAATTAAKDYGSMNNSELAKQSLIGGGIVGVLNGIIAAVTKGRVKDAIPEGAIPKDEQTGATSSAHVDKIINSISNNPTAFGLNKTEAQQAVQKIKDFKASPIKQTAPLTREQALNILARKANANLIKDGQEPIYPLIDEAQTPTQLTPQEARNALAQKANNDAINAGQEPTFSTQPPPIDASASIDVLPSIDNLLAHPRIDELLNLREDIKAKHLMHDNILVANGGMRELDGYGGTEKTAYDKPLYTKNYAKDMELTGKDVAQIRAGNITPEIQEKLSHDLGVMDNHPDYQPANLEYFNQFKEQQTPELQNSDLIGKPDNMSDQDWLDANTLFSKHLDNLAVATYFGVNKDQNGNLTFDPEKFLIGLGGYSAVKYALSRDLIKGKLKQMALHAIDKVNFNPEVQKENGINAMFVGTNGAEKGGNVKYDNEVDKMAKQTKNEKKDLLIHHNLTQDNLKFADENGGLAVPSLAVTKKGNPIDGFGDVTLLGDEALAKPKRDHKVFGADIYSPRYPKIENKLKARDERNIVKELQPYHEMAGRYAEVKTDDLADDIGLQLKFLEDKGEDLNKLIKHDGPSDDAIHRYEALKSFYEDGLMNRDYANNPKFVEKVKELLKSKIGNKINNWTDADINRAAKTYAGEMKGTLRKLEKGSTPDYYATRREVSSTIGNKYNAEYKQFVRDYYKSHNAEEKIYNGTDNQGRQKWKQHTLDNVVKKLKKDLRGGESFNYGIGSLRAKFTPQFKTLAEIKKNKNKLVTNKEFEEVKKEVEDEYFNLQSKFQKYHGNKSFDFESTFNGLIEDSIDSPIEKELRDYGFKNVPKELISELENFKNALKDMPTEYFESKVLRAMDLKEFKHAIIPSDASETTKNILKKNGIDFTEYDKNLPQDRINKIKETAEKNGYLFANGVHALGGAAFGTTDSLINQRDVNKDGKYNYKDLLEETAMGAISVSALKRLAPKLFEDDAKDGFKAGMFAGSRAKGFKEAEKAGKTFSGKYDGLDRFEIDDSNAKLNAIQKGTHSLGSVLNHKELYKNYPELSDTKITFTEMPKGAKGYFDKNANEIVLNSNMSKEDIKSSLLHEIQHAIQAKEGFAVGGSAQEFYNSAKRKLNLLKYENEFEPDEFLRDKRAKQISELESKFKNGGDAIKEQAFKDYQNLAGEIEARDTQARADLTAEQRAKTEPYSSENIPKEDANLRFNNTTQGQLNMLEDVNSFKKKINTAVKTASTKGFKHIQKIIGDEASKEWGDAANTFKRLFTDTLGAEYHEVRQENVTAVNGFSVKAERLHYALSQLSKEDRNDLHYYVSGDSDKLSERLKPFADGVKKTIKDFGKEMVKTKTLSQEAYNDWKDHYIYRTYDKEAHTLAKNLFKRGFKIDETFARGKKEIKTEAQMRKLMSDPKFIAKTQKKLYDGGVKITKLPNGKYEVRRDWTMQERNDMKEITDGAISIPQTLMRMNRILENANLLKKASEMDKVVLNPLHEKHFTHDEIDAMGYAKAPNSPKFGALAGKYVRKDVLNDIKARNDEIFNTLNGADGALARLWLDYLRVWKKSKTVWNAPSHVNNFLSNFYLMHLAGMKAHEIIPAVGRAAKAIYEGSSIEKALQRKLIGTATDEDKKLLNDMGDEARYYLEAKENGVLGRSQLNDILRGESKAPKTGILHKIDNFTERAYHNGDAVNRVAMFTVLRKKYGMSIKEAKDMTLAVMPDYTKPMPIGYKFLRDSGISPFISWAYYTTPIMYKMMKTKQGATKLALAIGTIEGMQWALTGGQVSPLSDIPLINGSKPNTFKGSRFAISASNGKIDTLKMNKWIPYIGMLDPPNYLLDNFSGPTINAGVNLGTVESRQGAIDPYTGRPIARASASTGKSIYKHIKYIAEHYAPIPSELTGVYNTIEAKVLSKKTRSNSNVIVPRTAAQETLKNLGLNTLTYSKTALQQQQQKAQLKALKKVMGL